MALHRDLTGSDLHEPKGVAGAAAGRVYVANGSGSGAWSLPAAANVSVADTSNVLTATTVEGALYELYQGRILIPAVLPDVSSASVILVPVSMSFEVQAIDFILGGAISGADATLAITRSDGASMGSQTISFSGSAEGTSFTFTPSGNQTLTYPTHRYVKIVSDGGSTGSIPLYVELRGRRI